MKILVMSDSHGSKNNLLDAVALESPEMILHIGDNNKDCAAIESLYPDIPLRSVRGNCDTHSAGLDIDEFVIDGICFLMTHGHLFGVKTSMKRITEYAASRNADVLLFGHTHIPYYSIDDGMHVINPGSIRIGEKSYAVLVIKNGAVLCEHKKL